MLLQTYAEYLKSFFTSERKNLSKNYPGITLHRLQTEAPVVNQDELYLSYKSHPFTFFIEKLKQGIPLEYISGRAYFYRSNFLVNEDVLIPRNETEILVELAVQEIQRNFQNKKCRVLDMCTGSGVIGLSLLREGGAELAVTFLDFSPKALEIARKNYFLMQYLFSPDHKAEFIESDRFNEINGEFELVLSNPPYIKRFSDRESVHEQVLKHEPAMALFLDDDEYDKWFKNFFAGLAKHLVLGGIALVEGHENHLSGLNKIAKEFGFQSVDIIKDYNQRDRFMRLVK